jgi:hypothetical protein
MRPLVGQELAVFFGDLTTIGVEGGTSLHGNAWVHGTSKNGCTAHKVMP